VNKLTIIIYYLITIQLGIVKKNQYLKNMGRKEIIKNFEKVNNILTTSQSSGDAKVCQPNI
jgi:hypothetical protein